MFLKDKLLVLGAFDKFKVRLYTGRNTKTKTLYDDRSPTIATLHILTIAEIDAREGRKVVYLDIAGVYLKFDMTDSDFELLYKLDLRYKNSKWADGPRRLYGLVEAGIKWFNNITALKAAGYLKNEYDPGVYNKYDEIKITIELHLDDLFITSTSNALLEEAENNG